jgi:NAD(P)-dependent dehydrogenase (short-subunit alcohol dehydrogenase family)
LTSLLHDALCRGAPGRIIWVSSGGMYTEPLDVARLSAGPDGYRGSAAYARAKRAQVTLCEMMAARVDPTELVVHAMHPGWALTPGVERSLPTFRRVTGPLLRTPDEGADTLVWLAADDGLPRTSTGHFWLDRRIRSLHKSRSTRSTDTADERAALWDWVTRAAGCTFPPAARPDSPFEGCDA